MSVISKKKVKKPQNVSRIKLPGIESYEKELEFTAEGPGRVVVRLERLMGSDRIRITDPKYLSTLMERLEEEETNSWVMRSRLRKKAEKNRSRQLAVDGLMEPAADMQDLYHHPVFRVNRILKRLAVFDQTMSTHPGAITKVPPIRPMEPFSEDESGAVFKKFSGHAFVFTEPEPEPVNTDIELGRTVIVDPITGKKKIIIKLKKGPVEGKSKTKSRKKAKGSDKEGGEGEEGKEKKAKDEEEEDDDSWTSDSEDSGEQSKDMLLFGVAHTLEEIEEFYGVPEAERPTLETEWEPYTSHLVDVDEVEDMKNIYHRGNRIEGVYHRQYLIVKDHVDQVNQKVKANLASGAYNRSIASSGKDVAGSKKTALASGRADQEAKYNEWAGEGQNEGEEDGWRGKPYGEQELEEPEEVEEGAVGGAEE